MDRFRTPSAVGDQRHVVSLTWTLDVENIDALNEAIPKTSNPFDDHRLSAEYKNQQGKVVNYVAWMHDRNISFLHELNKVILNGYWQFYSDPLDTLPPGWWNHWCLLDAMPEYHDPWKLLSWQDVLNEYRWKKARNGKGWEERTTEERLQEYIKHLIRRYEGEVALTWFK